MSSSFPWSLPAGLTGAWAEMKRELFGEIESVRFRPDEVTWRLRCSSYAGPAPWTTGPTIDDAKLGCIVSVPNLRRLVLVWTNVGDDGMKHVARLETSKN